MDIIKLILVFCVIVVVLWFKKPMWMAVIAASLAAIGLYGLSMHESLTAIYNGITSKSTIETLVVFYSITFLQRMMEKRKQLNNAQIAMNGLFNNNRINASFVPFLLGMLPAAGTVVICGPIVRESTKASDMTAAEKACITSYFRHISEAFVPTYTSIFIAIGITNGRVTAGSFILAMLPMVFALFACGYIFYLHRVPKDTGMKPDHEKKWYLKLLIQSIWPIALTIIIILSTGLSVWMAVWICIVINIFVNHFHVSELLPFIRTAFETKLMISTLLIMIFKELLVTTGVISTLPAFFSSLPIPAFLSFTLIFFFGTIVSGSQAIIVLCMPMAMEIIAQGHTGLALFTLLMCTTYAAMQLSPTHVCLTLCADDYKVPLGSLIFQTIPLVVSFICIALAYFGILSIFGL